MADKLRMDYINGLPQPFMVRFGVSDWWWEVFDIDVQTTLMRINVMGKLEIRDFIEVSEIKDLEGTKHDPEEWWIDYEDATP